ncbi:hypothetical protein KKC22_06710 [Myxococcota bacterium]|nr:hypothetical protein [Myxococcota bacterium]
MDYQEKLKNEKLEMIIPDKEKIDVYIKVYLRNRLMRFISFVTAFSLYYSIYNILLRYEQQHIMRFYQMEMPIGYERVFRWTYLIITGLLYFMFILFFQKPRERLRCYENGIDFAGYQQIEEILKRRRDIKDWLRLAGWVLLFFILCLLGSFLFFILLSLPPEVFRSYFIKN